ncbi:DUF3165 family protein [Streptococcus halichoeri]|uniref:DUF3165 family protein n=1 Tax=Streptococcus halichoeri TaxID=254785 RepID=UPI000DAF89C5|nr:DUF3165 family protein [Streptococcus halichoeri]PZO95491.1 MAG: DUF3165 domain-containing protein [Streptococcus pyogenes]
MFYLIVAVLIISYYLFMAPKSVRNTLTMIGVVGILATLLVLACLSLVKFMQSPPEILIALGMIALAVFAIRDIQHMSKK